MVEEPTNEEDEKKTDKLNRRACLNSAHMLIRCLLHLTSFLHFLFGCSYETFQLKFMCELRSFFFFTLLFWPLSCPLFGFVSSWYDLICRLVFKRRKRKKKSSQMLTPSFPIKQIKMNPLENYFIQKFSSSIFFCGFHYSISSKSEQNHQSIRQYWDLRIFSLYVATIYWLDWFGLVLDLGFCRKATAKMGKNETI